MQEFQLNQYVRRSRELLEETKKVFAEYQDLGVDAALPDSMYTEDNAIKLVFVGQYSAGKSSIIKMLSGIDTEIGAGIKTQEASTYKWNDLEIIDTPGIHTELRPDHDEKTYYQIDHAALLIFVVTNEGFDDRMGNHFRKLAIEQKRAKNMVLVVNKMDRTALGNVPEQQEIISKDIAKVIEPYKAEDLYLSFLDTESYFEWKNESDEEMRSIYYEQSGYEPFVDHLNSFVKSRGLLSQIQGPLETLKSAITGVIGTSRNLSTDEDIDALEEVFRRKGQALLDGKRRIRVEIEELADTCAQKIKLEGAKAANAVEPGVSEESVKRQLETSQNQAELYISSCEDAMVNRLSEICEDVNRELSLIDHSAFAVQVQAGLDKKTLGLSKMPTVPLANKPNAVAGLKNEQVLEMAVAGVKMGAKGAAQIGMNLPVLGKVNAAGVVKNVGHFFGHKFAPWGAANLVKGAANVLGWIGIAFTAYQILNKVFGDDKEKEMQDSIRKAQEQIRNEFERGAEQVRTEIVQAANEKMDELTTPVLQAAGEKIADFQKKKERLKQMNKDLRSILEEVESLMDDVQQTATT